MITSSVEEAQLLVMVQRRVTVVPAATPVIVVVGEAGEVIDALPLMIDQEPVPDVGALAAMVKLDVLHKV